MLFIENRQGWSETTLHPCLFSVALSVLSWVNSYVIVYFSRLSALFFDAQHRSDVVDGLCRELDDQAVGSLAGFQSSVAKQHRRHANAIFFMGMSRFWYLRFTVPCNHGCHGCGRAGMDCAAWGSAVSVAARPLAKAVLQGAADGLEIAVAQVEPEFLE